MARDGVAVDAPLVALVARIAGGQHVNVSAEAAAIGTSRQQVYRYLKRFQVEGVDGFFPKSRAAHRRANTTPAPVEDAIVSARKRLAELGLDFGATSIGYWLLDHPQDLTDADGVVAAIPSRATVNRVLARRGQLAPVPSRRPKSAGRRFVRPVVNDLWQLDGWTIELASGNAVWVIDVLDDHSRLLLASHVCRSENTHDVWTAFQAAVTTAGGLLPRQLLTDNARALNGSRRGATAPLEAAVAVLGVEPISTAIGHPQTNGKVERVHATLQKWVAARPLAVDSIDLQRVLDEGREHYNHRRRHQALAGRTPAAVWTAAHRDGTVGGPAGNRTPLHCTTPKVGSRGTVKVDGHEIGIGRAHIGAAVTVFRSGDHVAVFLDGRLDHERDLDRTRDYQPRHQPLVSPMS